MHSPRRSRNRILILGASSFVGRHLFARLGPTEALGTYQANPVGGGIYFDAFSTSLSEIIRLPASFSHAVILIGMTKPDACFKEKEKSNRFNVTITKTIIDQLVREGIVPVFISTESVFDGIKGNYVETDPVNPILTYGAQKVAVERYLQGTSEKWLIVRLARVFGSDRADGTLLMQWVEQIERNMDIRCATDQIFSPIHVDNVVEILIRLIKLDCTGIFHVANKDSLSRSELLKMLISRYRRHKDYRGRVVECSLHDFPAAEKRPLDLSMRPDKAIEMTEVEIAGLEYWCGKVIENW